jgi:hypothetical protein
MNSIRADVERPRENKCDRESRENQNDDEPRRSGGQGQRRQNRGGKLNDQPADEAVTGGDAIDFAPLQLAKKSIET